MTDLATLHRAIGDLVREIEGGKIGFKAISERLRAMLPRMETLEEAVEDFLSHVPDGFDVILTEDGVRHNIDRLRAALERSKNA